jgi:hypothetical protein
MKRRFFYLLLTLPFIGPCANTAVAQENNRDHFEYWLFRYRLEEHYVFNQAHVYPDASGCYDRGYGYSVPSTAAAVDPAFPDRYLNNYGDGAFMLGWYIATLATEYKLLTDQNLPTDSTLRSLGLALEAIDRLDRMAEQVHPYVNTLFSTNDCSGNLNGFMLRNDQMQL